MKISVLFLFQIFFFVILKPVSFFIHLPTFPDLYLSFLVFFHSHVFTNIDMAVTILKTLPHLNQKQMAQVMFFRRKLNLVFLLITPAFASGYNMVIFYLSE